MPPKETFSDTSGTRSGLTRRILEPCIDWSRTYVSASAVSGDMQVGWFVGELGQVIEGVEAGILTSFNWY